METKKYILKIGDYIKCFNGSQGKLVDFDESTYEIYLKLEDFPTQKLHVQDICMINGLGIDNNSTCLFYFEVY